tara:strand:+ start:11465 stop:11812 length:348 start_codon:yes stop_codon:yes gene_type:complete
MSRISPVLNELIGIEDPDVLMAEILEVCSETESVPSIGNYYTFIYQPKTSSLRYDAHPFVAVTNIFSWGFSGINFHWGQSRQYTFEEVVGSLHKIYPNEIRDLQTLPFGKIRINS